MTLDRIGGFFGRLLFPPIAVFVGFMLANSLRAVAASSLSSRVPLASERVRFMSTQADAQHLASSGGAIVSSLLLTERPDGALVGMPRVATFALVTTAALPVLVLSLSRQVKAREAPAQRLPA